MAMKESALIRSINKKIPNTIYHQAVGAMFCNGTPDQYYEGPTGCVWIEYKRDKQAKVSALQQRWLNRARKNGVQAWVIRGAGQGFIWVRDTKVPIEEVVNMIRGVCENEPVSIKTWDELTRKERIHLLWPANGLISPIGELQITALAQTNSRWLTPAQCERVAAVLKAKNDAEVSGKWRR